MQPLFKNRPFFRRPKKGRTLKIPTEAPLAEKHTPSSPRAASSRRRWLLGSTVFVVAMLALASLWHFTPLAAYARPEALRSLKVKLRSNPWAPLAVIPVYLLASFIMFPNMALDVATILTFGGARGWALANAGSLGAATLFFYLGRRFASSALQNMQNPHVDKIRRLMRRGGVSSVIAVRLVPIAPFPLVNLVAGAMGVRYRQFIVGTFLAMAPGTISLAIFGKQLQRSLANPNKLNILLSVALAAAVIGLAIASRRYAKRLENQADEGGPEAAAREPGSVSEAEACTDVPKANIAGGAF